MGCSMSSNSPSTTTTTPITKTSVQTLPDVQIEAPPLPPQQPQPQQPLIYPWSHPACPALSTPRTSIPLTMIPRLNKPVASQEFVTAVNETLWDDTSSPPTNLTPTVRARLSAFVQREGPWAALDARFTHFAYQHRGEPIGQNLMSLLPRDKTTALVGLAMTIKPDGNLKRYCLDRLIIEANHNETRSKDLVSWGLLDLVVDICRTALVNATTAGDNDDPRLIPFHTDQHEDAHHPDWWLAFDILTNFCKWTTLRAELIHLNVHELLLSIRDGSPGTYFEFEASEGLAYLCCPSPSFHAKFCEPLPACLSSMFTIYRDALGGDAVRFGLGFGLFGRVLCIKRLCEYLPNVTSGRMDNAVLLLFDTITTILNDVTREQELATQALWSLVSTSPSCRKLFLELVLARNVEKMIRTVNQLAGVEDYGEPVGAQLVLFLHKSLLENTIPGLHVPRHDWRQYLFRGAVFFAVRKSGKATALLLNAGLASPFERHVQDGMNLFTSACCGHDPLAVELLYNLTLTDSHGSAVEMVLSREIKKVVSKPIARFLVSHGAWPLPGPGAAMQDTIKLGLEDFFQVTVLAATHARLGQHSKLRVLPLDVFRRIESFFVWGQDGDDDHEPFSYDDDDDNDDDDDGEEQANDDAAIHIDDNQAHDFWAQFAAGDNPLFDPNDLDGEGWGNLLAQQQQQPGPEIEFLDGGDD